MNFSGSCTPAQGPYNGKSDRSAALAGVAKREAGFIDHSLLSFIELLEPQPSHWYSLGPNDSFCALQLWALAVSKWAPSTLNVTGSDEVKFSVLIAGSLCLAD